MKASKLRKRFFGHRLHHLYNQRSFRIRSQIGH